MNTQKYEKTVSLLHADGIHPISLRRAALLAAHGPPALGDLILVAGVEGIVFRHDTDDPHGRPPDKENFLFFEKTVVLAGEKR